MAIPHGGPAEYDRDGKRYDHWMNDPASGLSSGGDNNLDGDYYKARWAETGVIEADCLLCHMPGYDYDQRKKQLSSWNFRWAASTKPASPWSSLNLDDSAWIRTSSR